MDKCARTPAADEEPRSEDKRTLRSKRAGRTHSSMSGVVISNDSLTCPRHIHMVGAHTMYIRPCLRHTYMHTHTHIHENQRSLYKHRDTKQLQPHQSAAARSRGERCAGHSRRHRHQRSLSICTGFCTWKRKYRLGAGLTALTA